MTYFSSPKPEPSLISIKKEVMAAIEEPTGIDEHWLSRAHSDIRRGCGVCEIVYPYVKGFD
jgi:hypothetical protein